MSDTEQSWRERFEALTDKHAEVHLQLAEVQRQLEFANNRLAVLSAERNRGSVRSGTPMTATIRLPMPDGSEIEVEVSYDAVREKNPAGKEEAHYRGEDDGWVVENLAQL